MASSTRLMNLSTYVLGATLLASTGFSAVLAFSRGKRQNVQSSAQNHAANAARVANTNSSRGDITVTRDYTYYDKWYFEADPVDKAYWETGFSGPLTRAIQRHDPRSETLWDDTYYADVYSQATTALNIANDADAYANELGNGIDALGICIVIITIGVPICGFGAFMQQTFMRLLFTSIAVVILCTVIGLLIFFVPNTKKQTFPDVNVSTSIFEGDLRIK